MEKALQAGPEGSTIRRLDFRRFPGGLLQILLVVFLHGAAKVLDPLADPFTDLGKALGAKEKEDDHQNNRPLCKTHGRNPNSQRHKDLPISREPARASTAIEGS